MTKTHSHESAAAELLGALVLVAIMAAAVAVIAMVMFSHPAPEKAPALTIAISNTSKVVTISHEGGNAIPFDDLEIHVDGQTVSGSDMTCANCGDDFSVGDVIRIDYSADSRYTATMPDKVDIVYKKAGQAHQLLTTRYLGTMTPTPTPGTTPATPSPTVTATTTTATPTPTATVKPAPVAAFTGTPVSGTRPLAVQFTDASTNTPTAWSWDFGDGNTTGSNLQNPSHLYTAAGNYTVNLTATNAGGSSTVSRTGYILVNASFVDFVIDDNVFVYGSAMTFSGSTVTGSDATIIITGPLTTSDLNGGASIAVHDIYINGPVTLDGGSAGLGSSTNPGDIYVNGDMTLGDGSRDIYGTVYVAGDLLLKDAKIHGIMYVDGDVTLKWTPTLDSGARIYYTGKLTAPGSMSSSITSKCIEQSSVPGFSLPAESIAPVKSDAWYTAKGYVSSGTLSNNLKVFADSYSSTSWHSSVTNIVIVAKTGDITITGLGGSGITGVLFAPHGKVTFSGGSFEGVVIAANGFYVTSGGTTVTFKNLDEYFSSSADYPF